MQQQTPAPDYGFIMNPTNQPGKRPLLSGNSKSKRILIVVLGGSLLLVLIIVFFSLLSNAGKGNAEQLLKLGQSHTEIVRITELGIEKARGQDARNLAATTKLTLQSSEKDLIAIINKTTKVDDQQLGGGKNEQTDEDLTQAEQNNRFDDAFVKVLHEHLADYRQLLQQVYDSTGANQDKQTLSALYEQIGYLLPAEEKK